MKPSLILVLAGLLFAPAGSHAAVQNEGRDESPREASEDTAREDVPIPPKLQPPEDDSIPQVSIRTQDNGDRVEEYRQNGRLTMVKVIPERGAPYFLLDTNGDGRLDTKDGEGNVAPVYWTIYEWD